MGKIDKICWDGEVVASDFSSKLQMEVKEIISSEIKKFLYDKRYVTELGYLLKMTNKAKYCKYYIFPGEFNANWDIVSFIEDENERMVNRRNISKWYINDLDRKMDAEMADKVIDLLDIIGELV